MNPSLYFQYRSRCGSRDLDFKYRERILKMQQMLQKVSKNFKVLQDDIRASAEVNLTDSVL